MIPMIKKIIPFAKKIYFFITSTIRSKLIGITSVMVTVSIGLLVYIALQIFEENMKNMIIFLHSKATKNLSEKVYTEMISYTDKLKTLKTSKNESILSERYSNFLYFMDIKRKKNNTISVYKELSNDPLLKKLNIDQNKFNQYIGNLRSGITSFFLNKAGLENISHYMGQPLWIIYTHFAEDRLGLGILKFDKLYSAFKEEKKDKLQGVTSAYDSYLVDKNGSIIFHSNEKFILKNTNFLEHPVVARMYSVGSKNGVLKYKDKNKNSEHFGAFSKINEFHLGTVSSISEELALEGVAAVRWGSFLISIAILSLAILFIYLFSNTISEPIRNLADAADKIKDGKYDYKLKFKTNDEVGRLTNTFNRMATGLKEREKLKGALGKFVSEDIAKKVLEGELELGGVRSEATVFFSDIRQFTAISENREPEFVVDFLNQYMTLMVSIIHRHGGVVDKFIGDSIMAVWGTPIVKGNDIQNCLEAALTMRRVLIDFNKQRKKTGSFPILIGCGINTGLVLSGQIGSPERLEYTVIGDTVNLASRMESLCKTFGVDIIISENTYEKVKDIYNVLKMEKIIVKGKKKQQQAYVLLGRKDNKQTPKTLNELRKIVGINFNKSKLKAV